MEIRPDLPEQDPNTPLPVSSPERARLTGRRTPFSWWWVTGAIAAGLVLGIGGLELLQLLARPLALFILAVAIAAAMAPVVAVLSQRIPRWVAIVLVYLLLFLLIVLLFTLMVPVVVEQVSQLVNNSDQWIPRITRWFGELGLETTSLIGPITGQIGQLGRYLISVPLDVLSGLLQVVLVLFLSIYMLLLLPGIRAFLESFFPPHQIEHARAVMNGITGAMGGYFRGSAINGLIIGVANYIGMLVLGVPYAVFIGVLSGILELLPNIGPIISVAVSVLLALTVSPTTALLALLFGIILQQLENNLLVPVVMRSQANVSPLLGMFAVITGGAVGGLLGALVAIPLAAALQVVVQLVIAPALRRANGVPE